MPDRIELAGLAAAEAVIAHRLLHGLRLAVVIIVFTVMLGLELPALAGHADVYRPLATEVLTFVALMLVAAVATRPVLRGALDPRLRWALLAVSFTAAVVATAAIPPPYLVGPAHWSHTAVGWFAVMLLLGQRLSALVGFLAAHHVVAMTQLVLAGQGDLDSLVRLSTSAVIVIGFQLAVGAAAPALWVAARAAASTAAETERLRTAEETAEWVHRDRRERYAGLAGTAIPLLAGLADGVFDPAAEPVRRQCAVEAARMRRLFAESDEAADPLLHELQACIDVAERRGATVQLAVRGDRLATPKNVRRALTEPALAVLVTVRSTARVTVVGRPESVTVSVVADAPAPAGLAPETDGVAITCLTREDQLWVEATWRAPHRSPRS